MCRPHSSAAPVRPTLVFALLVCLGTCLGAARADVAAEAAAQDEAQRVQALGDLLDASPRLLGQLVHYVLAECPLQVRTDVTVDITVQSPWLAGQLRTELAATLQGNPSLAQLALQWLKLQGPSGLVVPLLASELTPQLLEQVARLDPAAFARFAEWLSAEAPETVGAVAARALRRAPATAANLLLTLARRYPQLVPRAAGFVARYCPALLPRLMRLMLQRGPVRLEP